MLADSPLGEANMGSPLSSISLLKPQGDGRKKSPAASVMLTSLIDAFSILVIYLLFNNSASDEIYISKSMKLPIAEHVADLRRNILVKVESDQIFVEDQVVTESTLVPTLIEARKKHEERGVVDKATYSVTVQADKRVTYKYLSQVVQATSHAGFSELKLAVISK